jgi:uncharacterized protein (DUF849 family)
MELSYYREVIERIRANNNRLVLNITTGPGVPAASATSASLVIVPS